jgi:ectoine hydroxylase-related dioxygenase (phytanoyl-CoA dioxygenase family)
MSMTDEEKWKFDLLGYVVLKSAVADADVAAMTELCDQWDAMDDDDLPPPMHRYNDESTTATTPRTVCAPDYVSDVFAELVLNREIMRVVLALTDNCPKHLNVCLTRNTREHGDIPFHGGTSGGLHNPAAMYQAADGKVLATFINASLSLVDVPADTGFVCIPGSHKGSFAVPEDVGIYDGPPIVDCPDVKAGDVVVFTETLRHGGRRWTGEEPRRTAFVRYSTSYASYSPGAAPIEEYREQIPEELYELKLTAGFQNRKKVVQRLLEELGEN